MSEKRKYVRYPIYCPIQYRRECDDFRRPAIAINLSEGGALIPTKDHIDVAADLMLELSFKKKDFFIKSKVVRVTYEEGKASYNVAIEFKERPEDFALKFYEELDAIIRFQNRREKKKSASATLQDASRKWYHIDQ